MASSTGKVVLAAAAALALFLLYYFRLDAMGLVGPDEPRYAAIGREMARSGDWITPRLWGSPWFEKPPLLYWLTGLAHAAGLGPDLAPRIPVALLSTAFALFFFAELRRAWGWEPAFYATAILSSSAAWVAFSQIGVTDLPLAALFGAAVLLSLEWVESGARQRLPYAMACCGLAVLTKGLVPLILFLPLLWMTRRRWRDLLLPRVFLPFVITALPWYLLCTLRNGEPFLRTFFLEHQLGRFLSTELQHGQPFWFYGPVLLASLFPWTVLLVLLSRRSLYRERHAVVLVTVALWGFLFFSLSRNKLGGYLLPLLPAIAALIGLSLFRVRFAAPWLVLSTLTLAWVPVIGALLPVAIASGLRRAWPAPLVVRFRSALLVLPLMMAGGLEILAERAQKRSWAVAGIFALTVASVAGLKITAVPAIDGGASPRMLYRSQAETKEVCLGPLPRAWPYGLQYYFDRRLLPCEPGREAVPLTKH